MTNTNIDRLLEACDSLQRRTIPAKGFLNSSVKAFNACMRAFDDPAVEAVTFLVHFNVPVMLPGVATIWRDGNMAMHTGEPTGHEGEEHILAA